MPNPEMTKPKGQTPLSRTKGPSTPMRAVKIGLLVLMWGALLDVADASACRQPGLRQAFELITSKRPKHICGSLSMIGPTVAHLGS